MYHLLAGGVEYGLHMLQVCPSIGINTCLHDGICHGGVIEQTQIQGYICYDTHVIAAGSMPRLIVRIAGNGG